MKRLAFAVLALWGVAGAVVAQEAPPSPPSWSGEGGLSFIKTSGNSETSTFGATLKLFHDEGPWRIGISGGYLRSSDSDVKTAERTEGLLRAERGLGERFALYGQLSYLRNPFAGIDGEETLESGGLYKLARGPKHFLSTSAALAYTWQQRLAPAEDRNVAGGRFAIAYKWQISPTADLTQDLDYLQSFDDSSDRRLTSKTAITAAINQVFAIKLGDSLFFYNDPVPGKKKTDNTIYASIVARWPPPAPPAPPCPPPPPPPAR